jgi:hypothetical protein
MHELGPQFAARAPTHDATDTLQDALHHSSLSFVRLLKIDKTKLDVEVTIGQRHGEGR